MTDTGLNTTINRNPWLSLEEMSYAEELCFAECITKTKIGLTSIQEAKWVEKHMLPMAEWRQSSSSLKGLANIQQY